jgi:hypothetical protein
VPASFAGFYNEASYREVDALLGPVACLALTLPHVRPLRCSLWSRSVYITKQVSLRNRVLILFDWLKTQVFGRDLSNF